MNAIANVSTRAAMPALTPHTMSEAMSLATMMAQGKLVPVALQKSPADCLMVIEQAMRWGMSPFAVAQEVSVIQGKLMFSGKIVSAAIHTAPGVLQGRLSYAYAGKGADLAITVSGMLRGEAAPRSVEVTLASAKTNNQWWTKTPEQMLAYHGARVWARRHAPEVMLGVYAPEEFDGVTIESAPAADVPPPRPSAPAPRRVAAPTVDQALDGDTIPDFDVLPPPPKPKRTPVAWVDGIVQRLAEMTEIDAYNALQQETGFAKGIAKLETDHADLWQRYDAARQEALDRIADAAQAAAPELAETVEHEP